MHADTKFDFKNLVLWSIPSDFSKLSKRAEKARLARASVIKLCWPLSFALWRFCSVLCYWCCLQTVPSRTVASKLFAHRDSVPKSTAFARYNIYLPHFAFFSSNVGSCVQRHTFVGIALGHSHLLSPIRLWCFLLDIWWPAETLNQTPAQGLEKSRTTRGASPRPDTVPPRTSSLGKPAACSAGERSANQTRHHTANTTASASGPSDALTRLGAYNLQLSVDTAKRLQRWIVSRRRS